MQCITIAFWQVNYALKSGKFQDAAFIRSSMQGGVDRTLFQACDGMFNNFFWPCFPEVVFIIGIPFPPRFHFMETLMLKITALFMQLEPLPRSRGRIIWNDKGNNRNRYFKWICLMCLWFLRFLKTHLFGGARHFLNFRPPGRRQGILLSDGGLWWYPGHKGHLLPCLVQERLMENHLEIKKNFFLACGLLLHCMGSSLLQAGFL